VCERDGGVAFGARGGGVL